MRDNYGWLFGTQTVFPYLAALMVIMLVAGNMGLRRDS